MAGSSNAGAELMWTVWQRLICTLCLAIGSCWGAGQNFAAAAEDEPDEPAPQAKEPAPPAQQTGRLVRVPLPITGDVDTRVKSAVQRALTEMKGAAGRPVLIFELAAHDQSGEGSDFGRSYALAKYLSSPALSRVKTVAFIPHALKGHAMLIPMACEEIVMAPDAEIGDAGDARIGEAGNAEDSPQAIDPTVRRGYSEIADSRKTIPVAVALGMLDPDLEVLQVETEVSREFALRSDLEKIRQQRTIQAESVLKPAGGSRLFSGRKARELGIVKYLAADRAALAKALSLPVAELEEDPSQGGDWHPVRVVVKGVITPALASRVERMIQDELQDSNVNFFCVWIDSPGGSIVDSVRLANFLAGLDPSRYRTAAYIPNEARGDAALIAAACDQVFMHPDAVLGGSGMQNTSEEEIETAEKPLREVIAPSRSKSWSLSAALVDPKLKVYRCTQRKTRMVDYFSDEELAAQADADQWIRGELVTRPGLPLRVNGREAEKLGLARQVVQNFDEFKLKNNLTDDMALIEPGWAHFFIDALADRTVAWLLLFVGMIACYAELHAPGTGIGGFIAGICFLLFFWSRYLEGTAGWLEVLLFIAGVGCVLLEIFVVPGAAIFGLGGGLMILASLILASQTFILPHNDYQFEKFRDTIFGLAATGVAFVAAAIFMRRFLPRAPVLSHMMLEPPSHEELEDLSQREALVDFQHLLGRQGTTTTQLTPSGKARFGNQTVDVIAEGEVIGRGQQITVIDVRGNRVLVRSASDGLQPPL